MTERGRTASSKPSAQDKVIIPADPNILKRLSLEDDFQEIIQNNSVVDRVQNGTNFLKNLFGDSSNAISKIFGSVGSLGSLSLDKVSLKPGLIAGAAGLGGIYTGLASIKNLFKTVSTFSDPKSDPVSWIVYALQSILEGGLTLGLASPFFNIKNPFAKIINGKEVVQYKTLAGGLLAPIFVSTYISMAKNNSFILRFPILGKLIKEIVGSVTEGLKHISGITSDQNLAGQTPPQIPNLGG